MAGYGVGVTRRGILPVHQSFSQIETAWAGEVHPSGAVVKLKMILDRLKSWRSTGNVSRESVLRRPLHVIDDENVNQPPGAFEFQAELLLDGRKKAGLG